jgi:hypothetical protein
VAMASAATTTTASSSSVEAPMGGGVCPVQRAPNPSRCGRARRNNEARSWGWWVRTASGLLRRAVAISDRGRRDAGRSSLTGGGAAPRARVVCRSSTATDSYECGGGHAHARVGLVMLAHWWAEPGRSHARLCLREFYYVRPIMHFVIGTAHQGQQNETLCPCV